jgi:hypothetical protein
MLATADPMQLVPSHALHLAAWASRSDDGADATCGRTADVGSGSRPAGSEPCGSRATPWCQATRI